MDAAATVADMTAEVVAAVTAVAVVEAVAVVTEEAVEDEVEVMEVIYNSFSTANLIGLFSSYQFNSGNGCITFHKTCYLI